MSYKDEDKNGEVVIKNLDAGTYTLLVQAEAGFEVPDATEATIARYEVIDNIMEQVVEQDADTEKEDPQAVREAEAQQQTTAISATTLPAVTKPSVTAGKKIITITKFKKNGDEIVYTANNTGTYYNYSDVESYINDDNRQTISLDGGSSITGYVYEKSTYKITDGEYDVVSKLLVEVDKTADASELNMLSDMAEVRLTSSSKAAATQGQTCLL